VKNSENIREFINQYLISERSQASLSNQFWKDRKIDIESNIIKVSGDGRKIYITTGYLNP